MPSGVGVLFLGHVLHDWFDNEVKPLLKGKIPYSYDGQRGFRTRGGAVWFGILFFNRGDGGHLTVLPFTAQATQKDAHELLGIEPVVGTQVLPRYGHARGVNDMGLDTTALEPAGQPEAVAAASKAIVTS
jgi:hypothetical protein